jgi:hypothetical protein
MLGYHRERVWLENSLAIREVGYRVGAGQVQKQDVEGNNPHRGHGLVCEGEWQHVGVRHGMAEVKLWCIRWLSPFLKLV